jgi:hypothetical protein
MKIQARRKIMKKANRFFNRNVTIVLAFAMMAGFPTIGTANWTAAGSTGTVDEQDLGIVVFGSNLSPGVSGFVRVRSNPIPATANLRYNVTAVGGLLVPDITGIFNKVITMKARYLDNGPGARVFLRLKQYNLNTGVTSVKLRLNSDTLPSADGLQTQSVSSECVPLSTYLDFNNNAYFVDAEIKRTDTTGTPALAIIQIEANQCEE